MKPTQTQEYKLKNTNPGLNISTRSETQEHKSKNTNPDFNISTKLET